MIVSAMQDKVDRFKSHQIKDFVNKIGHQAEKDMHREEKKAVERNRKKPSTFQSNSYRSQKSTI